MNKYLSLVLISLLSVMSLSCDKLNGGQGSFTLDRANVIGCWKVIQAKYDESATMTDWTYEDTYAIFLENGQYHGEGHFGTGDGTYSVCGNTVTAKIDNTPFIVYYITGIEGDKANMIATLQSNQMKIWMVCQKVESIDQYLEQPPTSSVNEDALFNTNEQIIAYLSGVYETLMNFAKVKLSVDQQLVSGQLSVLNPSNTEIYNLWTYSYKALRMINVGLDVLSKKESDLVKEHIPHLRALRAFIAYNLATLWGDAPFYTDVPAADAALPISTAESILDNALADLQSDEIWNGVGYSIINYLNPTAAQVLKGEILLAKGDKEKAKTPLIIDWDDFIFQKDDIVFCFWNMLDDSPIIVYSKGRATWLKMEAEGQIEDAYQTWSSEGNAYGYWQVLKRIGKAKEVTGCQDYQLLLPIPSTYAEYTHHQNPGY